MRWAITSRICRIRRGGIIYYEEIDLTRYIFLAKTIGDWNLKLLNEGEELEYEGI